MMDSIFAADGKTKLWFSGSMGYPPMVKADDFNDLFEQTKRLRVALREAYELRDALCRNGDDNHTPMDPVLYDKPLQRWAPLLTHNV